VSVARGLIAQFEVVHALALRETRTRFGAHQLGYLWALLEPAAMILTFVVVFSVIHRPTPAGMTLFGFIATGIVPYLLFSSATARVAEAINGNRGMLFYPHVQPLDLVFARGLLELVTYGAVFLALMGGMVLYQQRLDLDSALLVVSGMVLAGLLGSTLGLVFCTLAQFSNAVERARGPLMRPLFWVSGIFFTANELPAEARHYLMYNPLLHAVELVRDGWYPSYRAEHADVPYVLAWILGLAVLGLYLERVVRTRIELS
jgi:capsular polysaccharide transport system permease protein